MSAAAFIRREKWNTFYCISNRILLRIYVFEIIDELRESWPALKLNYNKMPTTDQHRGLENGSIDIAIGLELPHWEEAGY